MKIKRKIISGLSDREELVVVGVGGIVAIAVVERGLQWLNPQWATFFSGVLVFSLLSWLAPEKLSGRWGSALVVGCLMAFCYVVALAPDVGCEGRRGDLYAVVVAYLTASVALPLFEEKAVRGFLLSGVSAYVGNFWGGVAVSLLFAATHYGNFAVAFLFSVVLCWLSCVKGFGVWCRSIIHGVYNFVVISWGLGLFGCQDVFI